MKGGFEGFLLCFTGVSKRLELQIKLRINMKGIINIIGRTLIERGFFEMRLIWVWIF